MHNVEDVFLVYVKYVTNSIDLRLISDYTLVDKNPNSDFEKEDTYMNSYEKKHHKKWMQYLDELCSCAASALNISKGEFWVWYGNPFILPK